MTLLSQIRASKSVTDGAAQPADLTLTADVCVIGTGAGGAVTAATLAEAGHDVLMLEEGGYYTSDDFTARERDAAKLYQEEMQRSTADLGISILQGRAVGGTTVVNWTTCFRTPEDVVGHWKDKHHVGGFAYAELVPHWDWIERRLGIAKVEVAALNPNNRTLYDGCKAMGWEVDTLKRNVHQCQQLGMCGLGCPVNAKRSMLVTLVPDAIDAGARLVFRARADRFETAGGEVSLLRGTFLDPSGRTPTGRTFTVKAKRFVVSGGAINSPALLLRSGLDDGGRVGQRTFLHPVIGSGGLYAEPIRSYTGAPQSAVSHHFARRDDEVGFFLEVAPWYPVEAATALPGFGKEHLAEMKKIENVALHLAIAIDGFHEDVAGGTVTLRPSGTPLLTYAIPERLWRTFRFAQKRLAEEQFASGAKTVITLHDPPLALSGVGDLHRVDERPYDVGRVAVFTAHQMGGCAMGDDARTSIVRSEDLRHHTLKNLHVIDGSVFPTSLGVNPQESIYGLSRLMATRLAQLH